MIRPCLQTQGTVPYDLGLKRSDNLSRKNYVH